MPLHHAREAYVSPNALAETLRALGAGGVVMPGAMAWDSYPQALDPIQVTPNAANETDGSAATLIAAAALTVPYYVTHLVFRSGADGNFQLRFKIQSSTPTIYRILRAVNDRTAGPNGGIQSLSFPPIPIAASLGTQVILATSPGSGPDQQAYVTTLKQSAVVPVANLIAAAPTSLGGVLPAGEPATATTSGTVAWAWGDYGEVTPGLPFPALVTAVWGNIVDNFQDIQAAYATGVSGGEVDWGVFPWSVPSGASSDSDARHTLLPFPLYLPANTRIAVRIRADGTVAGDFKTAVEYVPVPLR